MYADVDYGCLVICSAKFEELEDPDGGPAVLKTLINDAQSISWCGDDIIVFTNRDHAIMVGSGCQPKDLDLDGGFGSDDNSASLSRIECLTEVDGLRMLCGN